MAAPTMPSRSDNTPNTTTPDDWYLAHGMRTPSEFHVAESQTGIDPHTAEGRYNVLNALNLLVCWHTTYMAAVACARGVRCAKGYSRH
jgi:hypothetical protein